MILSFIMWFICYGLSFLVQKWEWTTQGEAFFYIMIGSGILLFLSCCILGDYIIKSRGRLTLIGAWGKFKRLVITIITTWLATKLFEVDFFIAYQIMTFGQCLCTTTNKKEN